MKSDFLIPVFTIYTAADGPKDSAHKIEIWREPNGVWLARLNWPADQPTKDALAEFVKTLL